MSKGWVAIHRKIEKNPLWLSEPFTKAQAWLDLIIFANHTDGEMNIRGNIIPIKRGQIGWSELTMSKRWKWSRNKVRRFLEYLETIQQTSSNHSKNETADDTAESRYITTITTILNYDLYQNDTADDTAETKKRNINNNETINNKNLEIFFKKPNSKKYTYVMESDFITVEETEEEYKGTMYTVGRPKITSDGEQDLKSKGWVYVKNQGLWKHPENNWEVLPLHKIGFVNGWNPDSPEPKGELLMVWLNFFGGGTE